MYDLDKYICEIYSRNLFTTIRENCLPLDFYAALKLYNIAFRMADLLRLLLYLNKQIQSNEART